MQDSDIKAVLNRVKTIALVGASENPSRPSHGVMAYLLGQGYRVIPVSPRLAGQTLLGQTAYASLGDIPEPVDM
ncbi:CoA-binding protein, partial [Pectobacterium versatile]|nr:CoA-binding protein [Pectobacterium versatile]